MLVLILLILLSTKQVVIAYTQENHTEDDKWTRMMVAKYFRLASEEELESFAQRLSSSLSHQGLRRLNPNARSEVEGRLRTASRRIEFYDAYRELANMEPRLKGLPLDPSLYYSLYDSTVALLEVDLAQAARWVPPADKQRELLGHQMDLLQAKALELAEARFKDSPTEIDYIFELGFLELKSKVMSRFGARFFGLSKAFSDDELETFLSEMTATISELRQPAELEEVRQASKWVIHGIWSYLNPELHAAHTVYDDVLIAAKELSNLKLKEYRDVLAEVVGERAERMLDAQREMNRERFERSLKERLRELGFNPNDGLNSESSPSKSDDQREFPATGESPTGDPKPGESQETSSSLLVLAVSVATLALVFVLIHLSRMHRRRVTP